MARAIKNAEPDCKIIAYTPHRSTVEAAKSEGTIDVALDRIGPEFTACDYIREKGYCFERVPNSFFNWHWLRVGILFFLVNQKT